MPCRRCGAVQEQRANGGWRCRPCARQYQRRYYERNLTKVRAQKRVVMAQMRSDPVRREEMNRARRTPEARQRERANRKAKRQSHFFQWRVRNWNQRTGAGITAVQAAGLWMRQRGQCALTGERLDRTAELDHIMPKSRGGSHGIENVQWTTPFANRCKGEMTVEEFAAFCAQVAEYLGSEVVA